MPGSGLVSMLDADRIPDLRRLYTLFLRVPEDEGKNALRLALRSDIEDRGKAVNEGAAAEPEAGPSNAGQEEGDDPKGKGKAKPTSASGALTSALRWVQDVLDLKDKFDRTLDEAFAGDKSVQSAINEVSHRLGQILDG
jgi:cullin 3